MHATRWAGLLAGLLVFAGLVRADDKADYAAANDRADKLLEVGKLAEAVPEMEKALALSIKLYGPNHKRVGVHTLYLSMLYVDTAQYAKAEPLAARAVAMNEANYGKDAVETAKALNTLAKVYQYAGELRKAEPLHERALAIREAKLGKAHTDTLSSLNDLGTINQDLGRYEQALAAKPRVLERCEAAFGKNHTDTAVSLNNLANLYSDLGQYRKAEPLFQRALAIFEDKSGKDHPATAESCHNLGVLYEQMGDYPKAEAMKARSLAIREAALGKDHPATAKGLNQLGTLYIITRQYPKAEPLLLRSLAIYEAKLGKDHPDTNAVVNALAVFYSDVGQSAKSEALYLRLVASFEARFGKDHPSVALALNNLAALYASMEQYAKCEPLHLRALAIREAKFGNDHPSVAQSLDNLGNTYQLLEQHAKAEPLHLRALAIREAVLGKDHPDTAVSLNNLAELYLTLGQYPKAAALQQRVLTVREAKLGKDNPDTASCRHTLAKISAATADWDRAAAHLDNSRRAIRGYVADVLPSLPEPDQQEFLRQTDLDEFHWSLSYGLLRRDHAADRSFSAGWLLNGKAVAAQARAEQALLARESLDSRAGPLAKDLSDVRQMLANLALHPPEALAPADLARQKADLTAREQKLASDLTALTGRVDKVAWAELADVRKAVPAGGVLVEIARFDRKNVTRKPGEKEALGNHYAAWVIPPTGDVTIVDLGDAAPIDAAVAAVRTELEAAPKTITAKGEPAAEAQLRKPLEVLAKLALHPLLPHIDAARTWVVSPDGPLWVVPWAALPMPDGKYAAEGHDVRYVVTGRDLLAAKNTKVTPAGPIILADPDFDLDPNAAAAATKKLVPGQPGGSRGLSRSVQFGSVRRLPGTATEAEAIAPKLKQYAGADVNLRTDADALTGVFKAARNPRVVVLSTHGFFLAAKQDGPAEENVLLRCGLLLAGCNRAADAKPGGDTGVLTGLEIVGTDLRGTELVVLSACETGLGDVRAGDGVAGLRQAFQLAGAESVVATLWQVPDRESALLMTAFFDQLSAKAPRDAALATAQRDMVKQRRDRFGAAHPYFWAAYTLTGQAK